jgi:flagellar hook assembly protein FlgD
MHRVKQVREDYAAPFSGPQELTWNGRNELGYLVSNGTYFIRMENGSEISWTKVMVIN